MNSKKSRPKKWMRTKFLGGLKASQNKFMSKRTKATLFLRDKEKISISLPRTLADKMSEILVAMRKSKCINEISKILDQ